MVGLGVSWGGDRDRDSKGWGQAGGTGRHRGQGLGCRGWLGKGGGTGRTALELTALVLCRPGDALSEEASKRFEQYPGQLNNQIS